jgi:hypothetical protein
VNSLCGSSGISLTVEGGLLNSLSVTSAELLGLSSIGSLGMLFWVLRSLLEKAGIGLISNKGKCCVLLDIPSSSPDRVLIGVIGCGLWIMVALPSSGSTVAVVVSAPKVGISSILMVGSDVSSGWTGCSSVGDEAGKPPGMVCSSLVGSGKGTSSASICTLDWGRLLPVLKTL